MNKTGLYTLMNKRFLQAFFVSALCLIAITSNANAQAQEEAVFDTMQWKARVLVITGEYNDPLVEEQIAILRTGIPDLAERDIAVLRFVRDQISEISELSNFQYRGWYDMNAHQQRYVEGKIQSDNGVFSVVLVGKDGLIKKIWGGSVAEGVDPITSEPALPATAVQLGEIFAIIDAMPMREREAGQLAP